MALNINQFSQSAVQGQMDLMRQQKVVSCEIDATSAGSLIPGQPVKVVDSVGGVPKVVEIAANTDFTFGFLVYNPKKNVFAVGDMVEVATGFDDVMYMTAGAAVSRLAKLMPVVVSKKVITATAGKPVVAYAFDKAAADGDLIRCVITCPAFFTA